MIKVCLQGERPSKTQISYHHHWNAFLKFNLAFFIWFLLARFQLYWSISWLQTVDPNWPFYLDLTLFLKSGFRPNLITLVEMGHNLWLIDNQTRPLTNLRSAHPWNGSRRTRIDDLIKNVNSWHFTALKEN